MVKNIEKFSSGYYDGLSYKSLEKQLTLGEALKLASLVSGWNLTHTHFFKGWLETGKRDGLWVNIAYGHDASRFFNSGRRYVIQVDCLREKDFSSDSAHMLMLGYHEEKEESKGPLGLFYNNTIVPWWREGKRRGEQSRINSLLAAKKLLGD